MNLPHGSHDNPQYTDWLDREGRTVVIVPCDRCLEIVESHLLRARAKKAPSVVSEALRRVYEQLVGEHGHTLKVPKGIGPI